MTPTLKRLLLKPALLRRAEAAWKAREYDATIGGLRDLTGHGLHAVFGAAGAAPTRLVRGGEQYLYFSGVASNTISVTIADGDYDYLVTYTDGTTDTGTVTAASTTATLGGTDAKFATKSVRSVVLSQSAVEKARFVASHATQTAYTDTLNSKTWAINRSTAGKKSVLVDRSVILLGTDDYLSVADDPRIQFGAGASFTAVMLIRQFATPVSAGRLMAKGTVGGGAAGWFLENSGTNFTVDIYAGDGAGNQFATTATAPIVAGELSLVVGGVNRGKAVSFVRNLNGSLVEDATPVIGSVDSSNPLRIGSTSGGSTNQDFELIGAAVFSRVLSAEEITQAARELAA